MRKSKRKSKKIWIGFKTNIKKRKFTTQTMNEFVAVLQKLNKKRHFSLAACTEEINLQQYNIEHNRCIDGELMKRIFTKDEDFCLLSFLWQIS